MSKGLFDGQRAIRDFAFTDTWDPTTDHRADDWLGAEWKEFDETYGYRVYRCVKNTSGTALATARAVATDASATNQNHVEVAPAASPKSRCKGVTIGAIPNGYMGWVVAKGKVLVTASSGVSATVITANTPLAVSAGTGAEAGAVMDATIGTHSECGFSTVAVAAGATGAVDIDML